MSHVCITMVTWNSMKYLPDAIRSLRAQTYRDFTLIVIDNGSNDRSADFVRTEFPEAVVIQNTTNLGFARGHNQGLSYCRAYFQDRAKELYVLVMNPDIVLERNYLSTMVDSAEKHPGVGSFASKLMRMAAPSSDTDVGEQTDIIDSLGLVPHKTGKWVERGAGEQIGDTQYDRTEEVFGVSGALAFYRFGALEAARCGNEVFDEDFFVYKEDIDLAWRLRLLGYRCVYIPRAHAYHYRSARGSEKNKWTDIIKMRQHRSRAVRFYSYRNHFLLGIKNMHLSTFFIFLPRIFFFEVQKFFFTLFFEPRTLRALWSAGLAIPRMMKKRDYILRSAKVSAKEIREWFV